MGKLCELKISSEMRNALKLMKPSPGEWCDVANHIDWILNSELLLTQVNTILSTFGWTLDGALARVRPADLAAFIRDQILPPRSYLSRLKEIRDKFSHSVIQNMVDKWHKALDDVVHSLLREKDCPIYPPILCGFNFVQDTIIYLKDEEMWVKLKRAVAQFDNNYVKHTEETPPSEWQLGHVLAAVLKVIREPGAAGKYYPGAHVLEQLAQIAGNLPSKQLLGGAAGNMAYVLAHLGFHIDLHGPYFSSELPWHELPIQQAEHVRWIEFIQEGNSFTAIKLGQLIKKEQDEITPFKRTIGFQIIPGWQSQDPDLGTIEPRSANRALFIGGAELANQQPRPWKELCLYPIDGDPITIKVDSQGHMVDGEQQLDTSLGERGWPYWFVFGNPKRKEDKWTLYLAKQKSLSKLAREGDYGCALLGGIGYVGNPLFKDHLSKKETKSSIDEPLHWGLKKQLDRLREEGIPLHTELSPGFHLAFLKWLIGDQKPSGWSAGINTDDLMTITGKPERSRITFDNEVECRPFFHPKPEGREPLLSRLLRAQHLASELNLDWLYVHGIELDLAVVRRHNSSPSIDLGTLRNAMLLAKIAVIAAMNIRAEIPHEDLEKLAPYSLAEKGFLSLMEFAHDYAKWCSARVGGSSRFEEQVRKQLVEQGFHNASTTDGLDYDIVVAPVMWPKLAEEVSVTGAGDYTSAVTAAYAWSFHKKKKL